MEDGNITTAATLKNFLHLSYKNTITFFVTVLFNIFHEKETDDFWGLHKNMNCTFPLNTPPEQNDFAKIDRKKPSDSVIIFGKTVGLNLAFSENGDHLQISILIHNFFISN